MENNQKLFIWEKKFNKVRVSHANSIKEKKRRLLVLNKKNVAYKTYKVDPKQQKIKISKKIFSFAQKLFVLRIY